MTSPREAVPALECEQAAIRLEARVALRLCQNALDFLKGRKKNDAYWAIGAAVDTLNGVTERLAEPLDGPPEELCSCASCAKWREGAQ